MDTMPVIKKRIFILMSMSCYLAFCHLGIFKLNTLERNTVESTKNSPDGGFASNLSWAIVFVPALVADALHLTLHAILCHMQLAWTPTTSDRNARIEHLVGIGRAVLYAAFKVLLVTALDAPPATSVECFLGFRSTNRVDSCSWFVVFSPIYAAGLLQIAFHLRKQPEESNRSRNSSRRPGFSLSLVDLLALNISCELEGVFYIPDASWATVLWPLWIAAAMGAIAIFLGLCFAIPLLRRRVPASQLPFVLPPLVLLVAAYIFGLQGLTELTGRLDGDESISMASIVVPIVSAVWALTLLLTVVVISSFCSAARATGSQQEQPRLLSADMLPRLLVMESSTLFRQVSSRTLERYDHLSEDNAGAVSDASIGKDACYSSGTSGGTELQTGALQHDASQIDLEANPKASVECWVCFEGSAEAVLLQCGHAGLCLNCAENLWRARSPCPMCRQPIDMFARVGEAMAVDGKMVVAPQLPATPTPHDQRE